MVQAAAGSAPLPTPASLNPLNPRDKETRYALARQRAFDCHRLADWSSDPHVIASVRQEHAAPGEPAAPVKAQLEPGEMEAAEVDMAPCGCNNGVCQGPFAAIEKHSLDVFGEKYNIVARHLVVERGVGPDEAVDDVVNVDPPAADAALGKPELLPPAAGNRPSLRELERRGTPVDPNFPKMVKFGILDVLEIDEAVAQRPRSRRSVTHSIPGPPSKRLGKDFILHPH